MATTSARENILVVVLAGGEGKRLLPLTAFRTKPAVPIGAKYRLIDIPLSNATNSGLHKCLILTQGMDKSLNWHIKNTWYSVHHYGAFTEVISPQGVGKTYQGDADAVRQVLEEIKTIRPAIVVVVPGDHLLKMNYFNLVRFLVEKKADAAISVIKKTLDQTKNLGSLMVDQDHCITGFKEKDPNTPFLFTENTGETYFWASMGIYAFKTKSLFKALRMEGELFGKHIIPQMLHSMKVVAYNYNENNIILDRRWVLDNDVMIDDVEKSSDSDYWRDVGTIGEYFQANMDLTGISPTFNLYGEKWPFYTGRRDVGPAKIIRTQESGKIESAVVGEGSIISNVSGRSLVISPLVRLDRCTLENVIIFQGANIQKCRIKNTIIDKNALLVDMTVGFAEEEDRKRGIYIDPETRIRVIAKGYDHTCQCFPAKIAKFPSIGEEEL
jgi:glucose-1-phosphate adenylyltransferase